MPSKRRPRARRRRKPEARSNNQSQLIISRHDISRKSPLRAPRLGQLNAHQQEQRIAAFELLRLRRQGFTWKDAEEQSGINRRIAPRFLPGAFFHDEHGRLQVRRYDRYTRKLKIPTTRPGEFRSLRVRGSRKASLVGTWNNALKAAGRADFSLIDAFPRNTFIDGVRLATSHTEVSRIVAAAAESDQPFEDIYGLVGTA